MSAGILRDNLHQCLVKLGDLSLKTSLFGINPYGSEAESRSRRCRPESPRSVSNDSRRDTTCVVPTEGAYGTFDVVHCAYDGDRRNHVPSRRIYRQDDWLTLTFMGQEQHLRYAFTSQSLSDCPLDGYNALLKLPRNVDSVHVLFL